MRGFSLEAWLWAVMWRSANHPSSAAKMVETRRPPGPDDLGVAADGVGAVDQVKDGIDAARVVGVQRIDHVDGLAVVDLLGS